jgi:antitoxin component of RelBE/YafQ-DinJ toxin-antitoxin module
MSTTSNLQISIQNELRLKAEKKAALLGFDNLPSLIRFLISNIVNDNIQPIITDKRISESKYLELIGYLDEFEKAEKKKKSKRIKTKEDLYNSL